MPPRLHPALIERLLALANGPRRLLGVVGPPGAGKSTLALLLTEAMGERAQAVPMDGYHLAQVELERLGRAQRKGAPDTFDAAGYVALLRAIRIGDASFVVPLIGLKIFFIAGLSALFLAETYSPLVYAGGIGAMVGMFLLGDGRLHGNPRALALMLFTTFCYALTDIFLVRLFRAGFGTLEVMVYLFVVSALLLVPFAAVALKGRWRINRRFAGGLLVFGSVQLLGGVFLMWSFALAKVATMVNIVQSARGLFAVGAVWLITRAGLEGMEQLTRRQYLLRACGAGLMTLSITAAILADR